MMCGFDILIIILLQMNSNISWNHKIYLLFDNSTRSNANTQQNGTLFSQQLSCS